MSSDENFDRKVIGHLPSSESPNQESSPKSRDAQNLSENHESAKKRFENSMRQFKTSMPTMFRHSNFFNESFSDKTAENLVKKSSSMTGFSTSSSSTAVASMTTTTHRFEVIDETQKNSASKVTTV